MDEKEKAVLLEIDKLHSELLEERNGRWDGTRLRNPDGFRYAHLAEKLEEKVIELYKDFKPEYLHESEIKNLIHTCNKEVSYVKYHDNLAYKKNAAKIRKTELIEAMDRATSQIELDIISVLNKIKEVKE